MKQKLQTNMLKEISSFHKLCKLKIIAIFNIFIDYFKMVTN